MSAVIHHSEAEDGMIPKRFTCRRKPKSGNEWSRYPWIVECPQCRVGMYKLRKSPAAADSKEPK